MRSMLLVAAALLAPSAFASEPAPDLELALRVTATRLVAFNPTAQPQFVLLSDPLSGARATVVVAPQSWFESSFAESVAASLDLVVATRSDSGVVSSETWHYSDLVRASDDFLWFDFDQHAHVWVRDASGFEVLERPNSSTSPGTHALCVPPAHVSVITPCDAHKADLPPILPQDSVPPL